MFGTAGKETGKSKKAKADGAGGASGSGGSGAHPSSNGVDEVTDDEDSDGVPGLTSEEEEVPRMRYTLTDNFPINGATPAPASGALPVCKCSEPSDLPVTQSCEFKV